MFQVPRICPFLDQAAVFAGECLFHHLIAPFFEIRRLGAVGRDSLLQYDPGLLAADPEMGEGLYAPRFIQRTCFHRHNLRGPFRPMIEAGTTGWAERAPGRGATVR